MSRGCLHTRLVAVNYLGFVVVTVGSLKTMTKTSAHHYYKCLVTGCSVKHVLEWGVVFIFGRKLKKIKWWKRMFNKSQGLLNQSYLFLNTVRNIVWVLSLQSSGGHWTLSIYDIQEYMFTFSFVLWHAHLWPLLFLVTLCITKLGRHSYVNWSEIVESNGHGHWSSV